MPTPNKLDRKQWLTLKVTGTWLAKVYAIQKDSKTLYGTKFPGELTL